MTLEPSGNMWTTLDAMADRQGVTIERGDIVLVHTHKIMKLRMVDPDGIGGRGIRRCVSLSGTLL